MTDEQIEAIYDTLTGELCEEYCVPGVENLFEEGSECMACYGRILEAYGRLCSRLGVKDEDADVEIIVNAFMELERKISFQMFRYGMKFASSDGIAAQDFPNEETAL